MSTAIFQMYTLEVKMLRRTSVLIASNTTGIDLDTFRTSLQFYEYECANQSSSTDDEQSPLFVAASLNTQRSNRSSGNGNGHIYVHKSLPEFKIYKGSFRDYMKIV